MYSGVALRLLYVWKGKYDMHLYNFQSAEIDWESLSMCIMIKIKMIMPWSNL